jgi:hypothetical protein
VLVWATILAIAAILAFEWWRRRLVGVSRWLHACVLACDVAIGGGIVFAWLRVRVVFRSIDDANPADRQHLLADGIQVALLGVVVALAAAVVAAVVLVSASRARRRSR